MAATLLPLILAGGAGTRLWPLSREAAPKPFMLLPDGETLLGKTAARAMALEGVESLLTVTNRDYYFHTKDTFAAMDPATPSLYLLEPFGRNTAPAIALGALFAQVRGMSDRVLLVMPADHLIRDRAAFGDAVRHARTLAAVGALVTFGIAPTHPETGFGYFECVASSRSPRFRWRANTSTPATTHGTRECSRSRLTRFSTRSHGTLPVFS